MAIRQTKQRAAILEALTQTGRPLSPEELLTIARGSVPRLGIATVYRALRDLEDTGLAKPVLLPGQPRRYEPADLGHHHHFCCRRCDRVFDVPGCPSDIEKLAPAGFRVEGHELTLYGLCKGCT